MKRKIMKKAFLAGLIYLVMLVFPVNCLGIGQIDMIVDKEIYSHLKDEIDRFKEDIETDTGYKVKIIADNWMSPLSVRNALMNDFDELIGAILIGDIPITYRVTEYLGQRYSPTPSDYYYQRLKDKDWFEETEDTIVQTMEQKTWYARDIWTSRLLPPGGGVSRSSVSCGCFISCVNLSAGEDFNERIELLRDYFNRNHDYRTGQIEYDGMLYLESTERVYEDGDFTEELEEYVSQIAEYTGLYDDSSKVDTAYAFDHQERKDRILDKIVNHYEIISFNIHGSQTKQFVGGDIWINKNDILNNPPGALFVTLESCNNGDIRDGEYMAGWYLFSGNSLLVRANSVATFYVGWGESLRPLNEYMLVANGIDFGTIYKNSNGGQQSFLFGDPTLTIREKDIENGPRIDKDTITINLGDVYLNSVEPGDILTTAEVKNIGKSDLKLTPYDLKWKWIDDEISPNCACSIETPVDILPGQTWTISVKMANMGENPGTGGHIIQRTYYTNDPVYPYLKLIIEGRFL